ncbi:DMT family transporter [Streptomyces lichenis]|uniref:DMT family transporter n=2 Tax=Streptomyces lichenis TaxID=2306967 RepID=A0ABT0I657_9ACTN|nr:DMT family transporter [Streptomyces lichenis]MCK8676806.1 DMT family transporter [Streptomyces lichenis]
MATLDEDRVRAPQPPKQLSRRMGERQAGERGGGEGPRPVARRTTTALGPGLLLAAVATVVWSGSFVTSRALHDTVPPVQAAFWRWIVALAALAPFAARAAWRERRALRRHLPYTTAAALLGVTVYNTLVNQAGLTTPASTMGMVMAAAPVLMALCERLGGARLGPRRTLGMLTAFAGVLLLVGSGAGAAGAGGLGAGDLWICAATVCFASYSALLKRRPAELGGPAFLFATFVLGTLMLLPAYAASLALQGGFTPSTGTVGPLVYVGVFSSALAFFAWNKAIALVGAARAGAVYYLQPVCVALLSWVLLGEAVGVREALCLGLILGGVVLGTAAGEGRTAAGEGPGPRVGPR